MSSSSRSVLARLRALLRSDNLSVSALMARGVSSTLMLKIFYSGVVFATTMLLTRSMGIKDYGTYAYAISWITLLGIFANLGLESVVSRNIAAFYHARDWRRIAGLLRFSFAATATAATGCLFIAASTAWIIYPTESSVRWALWIALLALPLNAIAVPCGAAQAGFQRVIYAQIPVLLLQPLSFAALTLSAWWLFPADLTVFLVLSIFILSCCISLGSTAWLLRRTLRNLADAPQHRVEPIYEARRWLGSALPMMLAGSMFLLNTNADILMLGSLSGPEDAGVYKTAARGAELVVFFLAVVNAPLAPMIAKLNAAGDHQGLQRVVTHSARLGFVLGAMVAGALIVFGSSFLAIFGPEYVRGSLSLQLLCVGQLAHLVSGPAGFVLVMTGNERKVVSSAVVAAVLNVLLNAALIPSWGVEGAAVATAISTSIWGMMLVWFAWNTLRIDPTFIGGAWLKRDVR